LLFDQDMATPWDEVVLEIWDIIVLGSAFLKGLTDQHRPNDWISWIVEEWNCCGLERNASLLVWRLLNGCFNTGVAILLAGLFPYRPVWAGIGLVFGYQAGLNLWPYLQRAKQQRKSNSAKPVPPPPYST
jgi:hypothetical protein